MLKSFLLLFSLHILSTLSQEFSFQGSQSLSNLTSGVPDYIELPILTDESNQYYIPVNWKKANARHSNSTSNFSITHHHHRFHDSLNTTGKLLLNLYTNDTFVTSCPGFIPYDCDVFECESTSLDPGRAYYLKKGMDVYGYKVNIGIESAAFSVCGYSAIYAIACAPGFPKGISGFLGLGHSLNALFEVNKNFSIFLSNGKDGMGSALYAGRVDNTQRIDSSQDYNFEGGTDENWMLPVQYVQAKGAKGSWSVKIDFPRPFKALFDLNTDAIGLPIELYLNITNVLLDFGVVCLGPLYKPSCTLKTSFSNLPTFYLATDEEGKNMVEIRPQVYLIPARGNSIYNLQFGATRQELPTPLTVNSQYADTIVLGRPFLTFYYVHFAVCENYGKPFVTIYCANHNDADANGLLMKILLIAGVLILAALLVGGCTLIYSKMRKDKDRSESLDSTSSQDYVKHTESRTTQQFLDSILSPPFNGHSIPESMKINSDSGPSRRTERIWTGEHLRSSRKISESQDFQAHTYGKARYKGLYGNDNEEEEQ